MMKERISLVPAVYLFLKKYNQIFMARRYNTGYCDGFYSFVAGHIEGDETFGEAMVREAKEEANIIINPSDLKILHITYRYVLNEKNRLDVFMTADAWHGGPCNMEPNKCDHMDWFSENDIPNNTIPYIKHAILQINRGIFCSQFGFESR
ncbi:MAG TPA: NUDIX hydrolase [Coxiellaceae bacterium]|nr:NUDIX hydrolase [Coxiellaceae bacterium]